MQLEGQAQGDEQQHYFGGEDRCVAYRGATGRPLQALHHHAADHRSTGVGVGGARYGAGTLSKVTSASCGQSSD